MVSFFEGKDNVLLSNMFPTKPCTDQGTWCLLIKELLKDWSSESTQEQLSCAVKFLLGFPCGSANFYYFPDTPSATYPIHVLSVPLASPTPTSSLNYFPFPK